MLSRRLIAARPLTRSLHPAIFTRAFSRTVAVQAADEAIDTDPGMNGGYINPPAIKRSHRDARGPWWDPQDRRNYGEPVHEDNDILGVFSTEDYTHMTPARGALMWACFLGLGFALASIVSFTYPDKPAVPRTFPNGLEKELGGPGAVRARKEGEGWDWKAPNSSR